MMIAANEVAGLYSAQHGLAVPYRHQADSYIMDPSVQDLGLQGDTFLY